MTDDLHMSIFFKNKIIKWNLIFSFFVNLAIWFFLYWRVTPQVEPIFLKYNIYFGPTLIGQWWQIFFLPILGLAIILINTILSAIVLKKQRISSYFFVFASSFSQILLAILAFYIVLINS
jgi:hypothetical protein